MLKCRITIVVHLLRFPVIYQDIFMALMMTTCPLHLFMIYLHYRSLVKLTLHHLLQWNQHLQDHFPAQPILKIPRLISHFNFRCLHYRIHLTIWPSKFYGSVAPSFTYLRRGQRWLATGPAYVFNHVGDTLDLHDDETKAQGTALEMDNVVHDDAAVLSNVLDQLNDLHDDETKAQGDCPGDGQGQRCSPQQCPGPAQRCGW